MKISDKFSKLMEAEAVENFQFLSQEYISYLAKMASTYAARKDTGIQNDKKDISDFHVLLLLIGYY